MTDDLTRDTDRSAHELPVSMDTLYGVDGDGEMVVDTGLYEALADGQRFIVFRTHPRPVIDEGERLVVRCHGQRNLFFRVTDIRLFHGFIFPAGYYAVSLEAMNGVAQMEDSVD